MKFDATLPPTGLKDVPAIARAAEEIGFDALWTQETQHDPFLPCALIAEHTTRLNFGTAIAVSFRTFPGKHCLYRLGPRRAIRWTIHSGARHTGQGAHRAQVWAAVAGIGDRKTA